MDLARAIHKIDTKARYLLNHSQADDEQVIVEWRAPGAQPTAALLRDAWALCLADDVADAQDELERLKALERVKADAAFSDLVKALRL